MVSRGLMVTTYRGRSHAFAVLVTVSLVMALLPGFLPATGEAEAAPSAPPTIGGEVAIGLNFETTLQTDPNAGTPPDTDGSVGPRHVVEFINFEFQVFDKGTGAIVETRTLNNFWSNKVAPPGFNPNSGIFDPKIIYDPVSERWFAVAEDREAETGNPPVNTASNNFFIGRSDTDDPTGDWDGVQVVADTQGAIEFHDYPQVGLDADGLYICTQDFDDGAGTNESCYVFPKADLLQPTPSVANMTRFEDTPPPASGSWQPAVDFGLSDGRAPLLASTLAETNLQRLNITGANAAGAQMSPQAFVGDPGHAAPPPARQPDDTDTADGIETIENVAPRFVAPIFEQDQSLWAVHAVAGSSGNSALRWYEIDEATNTVVQSGLIENVNEDYHEPSIAVNELGNVIIGYTCSGPTLAASVCVSAGSTDSGGVTTFLPRAIVHPGVGTYWRDGCDPTQPMATCNERNRWGDYSSTVIDPVDPCSFWTFQEYTAVDGGQADIGPVPDNVDAGFYGVRAVEMTFIPCAGLTDLSLDKEAPAEVNAGDEMTYVNTVRNLGGDQATNVVVTDNLPPGVQVVSTAPACTQAGQTLTCPLGGMLPAQERTVSIVARVPPDYLSDTGADSETIVNQASVDSDQVDSEPGNNSDEAATTVVDLADMAVSKLCRVDAANAAAIVGTCDIFVDNLGPSDAQRITLTDDISSSNPFTVTAVTVTPASSGTCTTTPNPAVPTNAKQVNCDLGTEPANGRTTVSVTVNAPGGADVSDLANVFSRDNRTQDDNPDNNRASGALTLSPKADLAIDKEASPANPIAGETVTYDITVRNDGPSPATNTVVTDQLPTPVNYIGATSTKGQCGHDEADHTVECRLGNLASGETVNIQVQVRVPNDTPHGTVLANEARVISEPSGDVPATPDPDMSDNLDSAPVTVRAVADLSLIKTSEGTPIAGTLITYRYTIANDGPSWAQEVALVDQLPAGMTFSAAYLAVGAEEIQIDCDEVTEGSNNFSCPLGDLEPTGSEPLEVVMNILINSDVLKGTVLENNAQVISDTIDPNGANNVDSVALVIDTLADLVVVKTSDFDTYAPSATIKYTITVHNLGPSDSRAVVVFDDLPPDKQAVYRFDTADCARPSTFVLRCELGDIAAAETKSFNVYVTVKGRQGRVVNIARTDTILTTEDPDDSNNTSTRTVLIQGSLHKKGGGG